MDKEVEAAVIGDIVPLDVLEASKLETGGMQSGVMVVWLAILTSQS